MHGAPPPLPSSASAGSSLRLFAWIAAGLLSVPAALGLLGCAAMIARARFDLLLFSLSFGVGTAAFLCWWFALRGWHPRYRKVIGFTTAGALIIGGLSFAAGFFGPIILTPGSNQGPLLGIFITGPLGFVAGALIGAIAGWMRTRNSQQFTNH